MRVGVIACLLTLSAVFRGQMASPHPRPQVEPQAGAPVADFVDVAGRAGLVAKSPLGGKPLNHHLNEMTGGGVAVFDFDGDGWLDIFFVSGAPSDTGSGATATNHLYRNNHDGTFTDVTERAGLTRHGWGQGVAVGDYNGDGRPDLFVTYYGKNVLYRNNGDGTFMEVTAAAGLLTNENLYSTGAAFLDFDRDGHSDLFVAHYVAWGEPSAHDDRRGDFCKWRGLSVLCGPRGLTGARDTLYRNRGDGTFEDVSVKAGVAVAATYGFTPLVADFNNDGWPDIYVANDSTPSLLFLNNRNGTFTESGVLNGVAYNDDGREQSGMGAAIADVNGDGLLDILKTNFEQDTSTLYRNRLDGTFDDVTFPSGLGVNTSFVGWGTEFLDFDGDGWPDLFMVNGHIYPEVDQLKDTSFLQRKILYRNKGNGTFEDVSLRSGSGLLLKRASRGAAIGDLFNTGEMEIIVNNLGDQPSLLLNRMRYRTHTLTIKLTGPDGDRMALGARVSVNAGALREVMEVRSGGSYLSQSDLRLRFGLGSAAQADTVTIRWPDGHIDVLTHVLAGEIVNVAYGGKVLSSTPYRNLPDRLR